MTEIEWLKHVLKIANQEALELAARLPDVWDEGHEAGIAEALSGRIEVNPYRPAPEARL